MRLRSLFRSPVWLAVFLLLLITASRAFRLDAMVTEVTVDEAWSVWQGLGTPQQIIDWTPYDWPPGYYLTLAGWRALTGLHPITLRWLSVLSFAVGAALIYRVAKRLGGDAALGMVAYAAFGYLIFMSTELRGYILLLALYPLTIWLTLRYFDHPSLRRAIVLAIATAAMIYISLTSIVALGALALFTLIVYRQQVWRWYLPGLLALLLALPEISTKASIMFSGSRLQATSGIMLAPFTEALPGIFNMWTGNALLFWVVAFAVALLLSVRIKQRAAVIALLVWSLLPIPLYFLNSSLGFFNPRYAWWVMVGIALFLGVGLKVLPHAARLVLTAIFSTLMLLPIPLNVYQITQPPIATNFEWLQDHLLPGDVVLMDPQCNCGAMEVFAYYTRVYFPNGLKYVADATHEQRVWYITGAAGPTPDILEAVSEGRRAGIFVGPPEALFRLYEAPPDPVGIRYENEMRFHGSERIDGYDVPVYHEKESVTVRLWWSVERTPSLDYSLGLYILDETGQVVAQNDGPPSSGDTPPQTSQWQPGQLYSAERSLQLPDSLPKGQYRLMMAIYWYGDNVRMTAPGVNSDGLLPLLDFTVTSW